MKYTGRFKNVKEETIQVNIGVSDDLDNLLPYGYKRAGYIISDGTAYIDTGIVLTDRSNIDQYIEVQFDNINQDEVQTVSGFMSSSGDTPRYGIHGYQKAYMIGINDTYKSSQLLDEKWHYLTYYVEESREYLYNSSIPIIDVSSTAELSDNTISLTLFARNRNNGVTNYFKGKIGKTYLKVGNDALYDYIPCVNPNGVAGFYDRISQTFKTSPVGGLTAGNVIDNELKFANDSPVVIVQDSSDGIFSPIKSRSCTITIVASEPYYDMYSPTSHGTPVTVNNLSTGECLFFGYLTPCEYNQPYLYLNEIELEAVDAVSTLQDFKYELVNAPESSIRTIKDIVVYCLYTIAGYSGGIYVPRFGNLMKKAWDNGFYPMELECISEETFKDDDDMLSCYEILEEICNFYNVSLVPYGNNVYFVDYYDIYNREFHNISNINNNASQISLMFRDLRTKRLQEIYPAKYINKDDYAGDDQNIELDEVYNKITIKADVKEIDDDSLLYDPLDDASNASMINSNYPYIFTYKRGDNVYMTFIIRKFQYIKGSYLGALDTKSNWCTKFNLNCTGDYDGYSNPSGSWSLTDNFTNQQISGAEAYNKWKWHASILQDGVSYIYNMNLYPAQCCLPAQYFGYPASKALPYSTNWTDVLMFFPHVEWIKEYYDAQENGMYSGLTPLSGGENFWSNNVYENHLGGTLPVLTYRGDTEFQFSPATTEITNYLAFTGNLLWQQDKDDVKVWTKRTEDMINRHGYNGSEIPAKELGHNPYNAYSRQPSDSGYNTGWPMLKVMIKIGNKYWNGNTNANGGNWTTTPTTAWINYHKEEVSQDEEQLIWVGYNKPVTNHDFTYQIGKDAFCIPIVNSDNLFGKLSIDIYMPRIPYSTGTLYEIMSNGKHYEIPWNSPNHDIWSKIYINETKCPPVIFMKDLSLELLSAPTDKNTWYKFSPQEEDEEDDIIYSNDINSNNVTDFDDLSLRINTYNDKKPICLSYLLEPGVSNHQPDLSQLIYHTQGFYNYWDNTTSREEEKVIARYRNHYAGAKKIYNCQVHGYYEPWRCVHPNVLKANELNPIYMIVDSQEYDVKADVNELKLIQY